MLDEKDYFIYIYDATSLGDAAVANIGWRLRHHEANVNQPSIKILNYLVDCDNYAAARAIIVSINDYPTLVENQRLNVYAADNQLFYSHFLKTEDGAVADTADAIGVIEPPVVAAKECFQVDGAAIDAATHLRLLVRYVATQRAKIDAYGVETVTARHQQLGKYGVI